MHLVSCPTPQEPLEDAPRTALLSEPAEGEQWDGFWSSDSYYVRCTSMSGAVEWFEVADDESAADAPEPRILTLRTKTRAQARVSVVIAKSADGRRMLVGGSVRRSAR
jgi:hypothetical protein